MAVAGCTQSKAPGDETPPPTQLRVVSLSPGVTETLFAIDAGSMLVGVTSFCNFPPEAREVARVGGTVAGTHSLESILALRPDVVFAGGFGQNDTIAQLRRHSIEVVVHEPGTIEDTLTAMRTIGRRVGRSEQAGALVERLRGVLADIDRRVKMHRRRVRAFYLVWSDPLLTAGSDTFIGQLLARAGGQNIFGELKEGFPRVSLEAVVERDPELIIAPSHHGAKEELGNLSERPGWSQLRAIKEGGGVHVIDGDIISRPGPRLGLAIEELVNIIGPLASR